MEEWREVSGYSRYLASSEGRVWDKFTDKEVSQVLSGWPRYWYVNVYNDEGVRSLKRTHRLIAKAFCEGRSEERNDVDHINRDRLDNRATNLRWVTRYENNRNRGVTLFTDETETLTIKEWARKTYPETEVATYAFLYGRMKDGNMSFAEAVEEYEEYLQYGLKRRTVEYDGREWYLSDLCEKFRKDYSEVSSNLRKGWSVWEALHNAPPAESYRHSFSFKLDLVGVVNMWYPNKRSMCEHLGVSEDVLRERLKEYDCVEDFINHDPVERFRTTVHGVYGTREEICKHFKTTWSAVCTIMGKRKIPFEEAVLLPRQRIRKLYINGKPSSPKELWEMFGLNPKRGNKVRSENGFSFEETLEYFGKDTSGLEITF